MKNKDFKYINFYDYVIKVLSICKIGKLFSTDPYALENYDELEKISMKMLGNFDLLTYDKPNIFLKNIYPTPSVSCRCVIFNEDNEILFVKESVDGKYSLPGGWCDLYDTPKESILNEISQESGAEVKDIKLIGVINKTCDERNFKNFNAPHEIIPEYALIFKAKFVKFNKEHTHETTKIEFYKKDELPDLSNKLKKTDYERIINAAINDKMILD